MRIVYLNPSGQLGGAEWSLLDLLASLRAAEPNWELHLVASADGPLVSRASALGVEAQVLPFPAPLARLGDAQVKEDGSGSIFQRLALLRNLLSASWNVAAYIRQLRRVLRSLRPDIVHTNGFKMHLLGVWSRPRSAILVWHVRDYVGRRPAMARLLRWTAHRCAGAIANSRSVADDVQRTCGRGLRVHSLCNAVDLSQFSETGPVTDLDALAGVAPPGPEAVKVGLLGTMAPWKGHETFLQALSLFPPDLPVRGYIIGDTLYETDSTQHTIEGLRRLAAELGISHKVAFTGFVQDPAAAMRALDVVVHASTQPEPFGRVIAEAMACGRAVIASEAGGAAELIHAGQNALGHPPGDAQALANRIRRLAEDPTLRSELGRAGRMTAELRFDRARLATDLIPIYRGLRGREA